MKPIIGIISRPDYLKSGRKVDIVYSTIRKMIAEYGAIPLVIAPTNDVIYQTDPIKTETFETLDPLLSLCDGFLFQGGDEFYDYDLYIVNYAYNHNIPSLGICLGMQLMSVYKNGILKPVENHHSLEDYVHIVTLEKESTLYQIIKKDTIKVNSRHHEQVQKTDLHVIARALDGTIEAVEDSKKRFFVGVQWHPEDMIAYDEMTKQLMKFFIEKCRECKNET